MQRQEAINLVREIVQQVAKNSGIPARVTCPAAVWDNTGDLVGVSIESPKKMGGRPCLMTASFVLTSRELTDTSTVKQRASVAMEAIRFSIQSKVRPVKAVEKAA